MADFTFKKPGNWRYPQFPVEPSHIGEGRVRVDVSFASFLCAREKEGKNGFLLKGNVTLATPKVLSLGNEKKNFSFPFAFLSFIRTFAPNLRFERREDEVFPFIIRNMLWIG